MILAMMNAQETVNGIQKEGQYTCCWACYLGFLESGKVIQGLHQVASWMKDPDPHTDGKVTFGAAGASGVISHQNKGQYTCGLIVGASILPKTCMG
jgi:hypothetical protein